MSPISLIGSHLLALAFPASLFSLVMYLVGHLKSRPQVLKVGQRGIILTFVLLTLSVVLLIFAFISDDFSIQYVYGYSSITLPLFYKITGLWAGLDGSILFWTWLVSLFAVIVYFKNREKSEDWMPYINAVMMVTVFFFLILMLFVGNPFTPLGHDVIDGKGLNPLLQNIGMVFHPPSLYVGFTGFTVPFAFMVAALVTRRLDSTWIDDTRRWTIISWLFLAVGNLLGGAWAYVELGWGGFWAWDPIENAGLLPWLVSTAYLHSVIAQKRRGVFQVWNVFLISLTFFLTVFGTYLTRSGVVQSVHAFSASQLGPFFLVFLAAIAFVSLYLILTRASDLKSESTVHYLSKESALLFNNVVLVVATIAILWGTLFPTLAELFSGQRITVGPPFFNQMMAPVGLILLFLMGVGPMISWKKASFGNLKSNLLIPFIIGVVGGIVVCLFGLTKWYFVGSMALALFVMTTLYLEFSRGIRIFHKQKGISLFSAAGRLISHSNRRYGAYIVHLGIVLMLVAISGEVYKSQANFSLMPGGSFQFKEYRFAYQKPVFLEMEHRSELRAVLTLFRNDKKLDVLEPARFFYKTAEQPSTEVDVHISPLRDVYLILANLDPFSGRGDFRVTINPLISFMWLGGIVLLIGAVIVLLPRRE